MRTVLLADEQPELLEQVPAEQRVQVAQATAVAVVSVPAGDWRPERRSDDPRGHYGLLVLDGLLARRVHLGNRECVELLGAGDLLRPWIAAGERSTISVDARWVVHTEARIALLDRGFAARVARWPEVTAALMDRLVLRSRWLAFHLAVCHLAHLQTRLRVMFWYLADRWGRVTPEGVVVPLRLTHELLGGLVGARRPATTTALGELTSAGRVERRSDGSWLLHGDPPAELREVQDRALGGESVLLN